jgi:hypothetical protein
MLRRIVGEWSHYDNAEDNNAMQCEANAECTAGRER